ncbi:MAG: agmatinase family protein [Myxococcales bacterium]|nr:agmatinase family protein [Myxococcales bacterium]
MTTYLSVSWTADVGSSDGSCGPSVYRTGSVPNWRLRSPWARRYQPRVAESIYGVGVSPDEARVVLIPIPWEATTSYGRGTGRGPEAILRASAQVDLFDLELESFGVPEPYRAGIAMLPVDDEVRRHALDAAELATQVLEAYADPSGDDRAGREPSPHDHSPAEHAADEAPQTEIALARVNAHSRWLDAWLARTTAQWLDRGKIVGVVGGDHSVPFGSIATQILRRPSLGLLHFDAHADLRVAYQGFIGSHASIMHRVVSETAVAKLVSVGVRDFCREEHTAALDSGGRIVPFYDARMQRRLMGGESFDVIVAEIVGALPQEVYVSFDIDGLEPGLCPHTGTPVPGGLSFRQATRVLEAVVESGRKIVGFDLCEVAPGPDGDEWDANVGARLLYKLIGYALVG